jgi:hypothetical protein
LSVLGVWGYFPGKNWAEWSGGRMRQQMLQLVNLFFNLLPILLTIYQQGFIMYFQSDNPDAEELSTHFQQGGRGQTRRSHRVFEARNFICAHIKRDEPSSRRFIQYLSMQSHRCVMLVRDAETGKLLIKPPDEERWLYREKAGLGRAAKNAWNVIKRVGTDFFEDMEKWRQWKFSFKEYYDIYIWDLEAGEPFPVLYNCVQEVYLNAPLLYSF